MRKTTSILLEAIPSDELKRLKPFMETVQLVEDQKLCEFDKPIEYVYLPHTAVTSTIVDTEDGPPLEVGLMGAEGMVGLSLLMDEDRSNSTVIVQIAGQATRIRTSDFKQEVIQQRGPFFRLLQRYCNAFMGMVAQSAVCNSRHTLDERACRWILMTHDRFGEDQIPLNQKFLAIMLSAPRSMVSLTLSRLKEAGLVDYTRRSITVVKRAGLEDASCECYRVINRQFARVFDKDWEQVVRKP